MNREKLAALFERAKSGDREALAAIVDWLNPQIVHGSCIKGHPYENIAQDIRLEFITELQRLFERQQSIREEK